MSMLCYAMNYGCSPHFFKLKHINIKTFNNECEKNLMVSDYLAIYVSIYLSLCIQVSG